MSSSRASISTIIAVGFMLFALFFGAGNLIFPVKLGQMAGENAVAATAGFIATGVGLPILAILALLVSGKDDVQSLGSRVHPVFGLVFTIALYLAIGPMFAIPRTATVSFEIGILPFIGAENGTLGLFVFSLAFFGITLYFSLKSNKMVDIIGKILTPFLLLFIAILIIAVFFNPIGDIQPPIPSYTSDSFFLGFQEGYLTMDALAAFVFGIIIIDIMKYRGPNSKKGLMSSTLKVAILAGFLLAAIYASLAYLGATSVEGIGLLDNGGAVLAAVSQHYFGFNGNILLALIVIGACLTTSIGLIISCASYFHKIVPSISYKKWAIIFVAFSTAISNVGLSTIIEISVPILSIIYPLAIALIILTFLHPIFKGKKEVYQLSMLMTFIVSIIHNFGSFGIEAMEEFFTANLVGYSVGLGWLLPAFIAGLIGYIVSMSKKNEALASTVE